MDVANLEEEILKLNKGETKDVKTPANDESKDGENSDLQLDSSNTVDLYIACTTSSLFILLSDQT